MSPSKIEWTEETWNPTTGCDRCSPGCDNCYALTMAARLKRMGNLKYRNDGDPRTSGPGFGLTLHDDALTVPLRWQRPRRVFVDSMSDLFHPGVPVEFIGQVVDVMATASQHTFQVLTKRPQRMWKVLRLLAGYDGHVGHMGETMPLPNVWWGATIESDPYAWRANHVRSTLAAVRFLSLEPLLGPLPSLKLDGMDWVIVGGESGHGSRPMDLSWARDIVSRCRDAGVPVFVKQLGAAWPGRHHRDLKGHDMSTWPEDLRVREYPMVRAAS